MDLVVDLNFRMDTSALYSDVVLPAATWYEKADINSTDMHSFIHPLSKAVPTTGRFRRAVAEEDAVQRRLWTLAGQALTAAPQDSAPRLYVETLNEMIDQQTVRIAALNNRIPNAVLALEVLGAAFAFGLLALYTAMHGRGATTVVLAGALVTLLLLVIFDLDRPTRGLIRVPDTPLLALQASMALPPRLTVTSEGGDWPGPKSFTAEGKLNGGGPTLKVRTTTGDIKFLRASR